MKICLTDRRLFKGVIRTMIAAGVAICAVASTTELSAQNTGFGLVNAAAEAPLAGRQIQHDGLAFDIVDASSVRTADLTSDSLLAQPIAQVSFAGKRGCKSCGTSCGGACGTGSCGTGDCGVSYGGGMGMSMPCPPSCIPYGYVMAEALYMDRHGQNSFTGVVGERMGTYDFEWAPRVTVGNVPDCVHGTELGFTGPIEWDRAGLFVNFADIQAVSTAAPTFNNSDDDAEFSGLIELGSGVRYELGKALTVRAGGEMWYVGGLATSSEVASQLGGARRGSHVFADDGILVYGLTVGAELRY